MQISKQRILGLLVFPAVVLAGLVLLRPAANSHVPVDAQPNARNKDTPHQAETATPSPPPLAQSASPAAAAAASSVSAPSPAQLWAAPGETTGEKLDPKSVSYAEAQGEGVKPKGRSSPFDPGSLTPLAALRRGDNVVLPLLGGEQVTGKVNLVQQEAGWVRVGGELTGPRSGSFSLGSSGKNAGGTILLPQEQIAYAITEQPDGQVVMQEKPLSEVICFPIPRPRDEPVAAVRGFGPQEAPPILSSRPGAAAVLYLDFDGETVTDPNWNSGNTIVAQPSSLTSAQITEVWNRVKEDYWPFNIDVTTDRNRYNNAPVGSRMRCIITPTDTAAPGFGGVAYLNSFDKAGSLFSSTIPCWVFNSSVVGVAEAASHEFGHTFGLYHDGRTSPAEAYYQGHGTGAVSWGPIMGCAYTPLVVQWSKGEYASANNQEDDLAIIANAVNGFGYVADEAGNSLGSAGTLNAPGGAVNQTGIISPAEGGGNNDVDFYAFTAGVGVVIINANPASISPNLDILLQVQNSAGTVVASSNPDTALNATVSCGIGAVGTYYITVQGTGRGAVLGDGYSNYGSIGHYSLSGTVPLAPPSITTQPQPQSQTVTVGSIVTFSVSASGSWPLYYQWRLNGANITGATGAGYTITAAGTSDAGNYSVAIANAVAWITSTDATLAVLLPFPGIYNTGLSDSRTVLTDGQVDPHYKLVVNPSNPASSSSVVHDSTVFPIVNGPWIQNSSKSKWIGPARDTVSAAAGNYSYQLNLDLSGYDPRTAYLAGSWAVDDSGSIFLNGVDTGFRSTNIFYSFSTFTLTNGFVRGTNLIEFRVNNGASWTGLRVENLRATAQKEAPGLLTRLSPTGSLDAGSIQRYAWKADAAADWYELYVLLNGSLFCDKWFALSNSVSGDPASFAVDIGGHGSGSYQWYVRGWSPGGYGPWSSPGAFTLGIPGAVALLAPANGASLANRHPELTWSQAVPAATWFRLYVTRNGSKYLDQWVEGLTNWKPTADLLAGSYSWWVQPYNAAGLGPRTANANFTIPLAVPGALALVSPTGGGVEPSLKQLYTCRADAAAAWYELYIVQNGKMLCDKWLTLSNSVAENGSGNFAVVMGGHTGGSYQWWVRGWGPDGLGPWSSTGSFTMATVPPPGPVTLLTPADSGKAGNALLPAFPLPGTNNANVLVRQPEFTWTASSPEASWYRLYVVRNGSKYVDQWVEGVTNFVLASDLPGGSYAWAVLPWSEAGSGLWSTNFTFTIQTAVPGTLTLLSPSNSIASGLTQRYTWAADAAATWYELYVMRNGSAFGDQWYTLTNSVADTNSGNFAVDLGGHSAGTYQWWVRGWGPDGLGIWSGPASFTSEATP
jgi:hypothetical protein